MRGSCVSDHLAAVTEPTVLVGFFDCSCLCLCVCVCVWFLLLFGLWVGFCLLFCFFCCSTFRFKNEIDGKKKR